LPLEALRWSIFRASREVGVGEAAISMRLAAAGEAPGADNCYSSGQIARAVVDSVRNERLKKARSDADTAELLLERLRSQHVKREELLQSFSAISDAITRQIKSSRLTRDEKRDCLQNLASLPVIIADLTGQPKAPFTANGANGRRPTVAALVSGRKPRRTRERKTDE
jgi:hypothetical protein